MTRRSTDPARPTPEGVLRIDCDECRMQHTDVCADCVVTFVCSRPASGEVVFDVAEARAVRALSDVGLVPALRLAQRGA